MLLHIMFKPNLGYKDLENFLEIQIAYLDLPKLLDKEKEPLITNWYELMKKVYDRSLEKTNVLKHLEQDKQKTSIEEIK